MMKKMKNKNTSIIVIQPIVGGKNLDSIKCMYSGSFASLWMTLICVVFTACSTTKNLPAGETLYAGIDKLEVLNEDKTEAGVLALTEVEAALAYAPNNAIFGSSSMRWPLPIGLWVYNGFEKYQDKKGVGRWIFDHLGTQPVLMSSVNGETRAKVATNL